jgi:selenocysteine lyase/cysteine desulfurase
VSFVGDASTAWNQISNGLAWKPGDNVVINEFEHPSVVYPWLRLKPAGLDVRVVTRDADWKIEPAAIERACDARTKAIAVSQVGYVTGFRHDTKALAAVADRFGVPLFVDVSHALGVVPIDISDIAIAVSASYKWLLGCYGAGVVVWNRERLPDFRPGAIGWRSTEDIFTDERFERCALSDDARRFQLGAPSFAAIAALGAAVEELLQLPSAEVSAHAAVLAGNAIDGLRELGLTVVTPEDPEMRAGNVAFLHPAGELVADALSVRGVPVWGGDGRVRASFHVLNGGSAVNALLSALRDALGQFKSTEALAGSSRR